MDEIPERDKLIGLVTAHTCMKKCFGRNGYSSSCCRLEDRDFIIGPISPADADAFLHRLSAKFKRPLTFNEVFIGFEEGSKLFPRRSTWRDPKNYPALRPISAGGDADYQCQFLGASGECTVYEERPPLCRIYRCEHLVKVIDLL